jgi:hypothetical protein
MAQAPSISAPSMIAAPAVADAPAGFSADQIRYLASEGRGTGEYAANRAAIMKQLRGESRNPVAGGGAYSLSQPAPGLVPPVYQQQTHQTTSSGVQVPNAQAMPPGSFNPAPMANGQVFGQPFQTSMSAPQPAQLQVDLGAGAYAPNGGSFNPAAARAAADAAVAAARAKTGR